PRPPRRPQLGAVARQRRRRDARRREAPVMRRVLHAGTLASLMVAALAVTVSTTGWLYLLRPFGPATPRVGDALPLDELARRGATPLLLFVAVWAGAAALLALIARAAGAERLTAAFLLVLGVGLWSYLATGVALLIVRQIPAHDAFAAAAGLRAVYVPAALAGLGGAVAGKRRTTRSPRAPFVLGEAGAVTGLRGRLGRGLP